jgi:hypothetical protein
VGTIIEPDLGATERGPSWLRVEANDNDVATNADTLALTVNYRF